MLNAGAASAANQYGTEVVNRYNGLCLDVAHASSVAGASVVQGTCWGGTNQAWRLQYVESDWWTGAAYYQLRVVHSDQCLDVEGGSGYDGARMTQWHCYGGHNQQFRRVYLG